MSFGYVIMGFGAHANRSVPLAISLNSGFTEALDIAAPAGSGTVSSNAGEIDMTASASGGDGSYSYAWTVTEAADTGNNFAVNAAGTQNAAQYNTLTINGTMPSSRFDPPNSAIYTLRCTVTDGNSDTAFVEQNVAINAVGL
jgi:FlaG/FlaF family flagellin (archaellin)